MPSCLKYTQSALSIYLVVNLLYKLVNIITAPHSCLGYSLIMVREYAKEIISAICGKHIFSYLRTFPNLNMLSTGVLQISVCRVSK